MLKPELHLSLTKHSKERANASNISLLQIHQLINESKVEVFKLHDQNRILIRLHSIDLVVSSDLTTIISIIGTCPDREIVEKPTLKNIFQKAA